MNVMCPRKSLRATIYWLRIKEHTMMKDLMNVMFVIRRLKSRVR